ncbi:HAD family hydrolase [Sphingomonas rubra]|uniref:Haloacid dehalogenase superfamily, subfamily IA, variant 3 with third motif having DD or ED n=1 Tax=Sphingomonas rubra TaxID=634430 RepID=A0A1I5TIA2_9SPHN|nr:HAD family phosphatase [Sphingomonas rubra]SFP82755.1 haloacid dehalogenase superfamily, subfamily IA, variant 3 with third motif having DD or ED [Sphingomonas rubra]
MTPEALLFDFDGVLIESEAAGNRHIADWLSANGHPTSAADSMANFMGLSGPAFTDAIERWIGGPLPAGFAEARRIEDARVLAKGVGEVTGAVAFVRALPADLPRAIVSSSSTAWIAAHLDHLGLRDAFGDHLYSGREHVANGKPAPDLYLHATAALGVGMEDCAIIEDSFVGVTGAVKTGATVIGLCAGTHCASDHAERLLALGVDAVAADFAEVARLLRLHLRSP